MIRLEEFAFPENQYQMSDVKKAMKSRSALTGSVRVSQNSRQYNESFGSARDFRM